MWRCHSTAFSAPSSPPTAHRLCRQPFVAQLKPSLRFLAALALQAPPEGPGAAAPRAVCALQSLPSPPAALPSPGLEGPPASSSQGPGVEHLAGGGCAGPPAGEAALLSGGGLMLGTLVVADVRVRRSGGLGRAQWRGGPVKDVHRVQAAKGRGVARHLSTHPPPHGVCHARAAPAPLHRAPVSRPCITVSRPCITPLYHCITPLYHAPVSLHHAPRSRAPRHPCQPAC